MFKLLPDEERSKVRREYVFRRIDVVLQALVVVLLVTIVGLMPSYLLSQVRQNEIDESNKNIGLNISQGEVRLLKTWLDNFKLKLDTTAFSPQAATPSIVIQDVIGARGPGITLTNFVWGKDKKAPTLSISGVAKTRQGLLSFEKQLKDSDHFSQVVLPVSNLAKDKDVPFQVQLYLK